MEYIWQCAANNFVTIDNYIANSCLVKNNGKPCMWLRKIGVDNDSKSKYR
jgi:hypothetical protein